MADQDYPTLHSQLLDQTARMKITVSVAEKVVYGPAAMVQTPGGPMPSIAKRINDRIEEITGIGPVTWSSVTEKPEVYPTRWDMIEGKPTDGGGGGGGSGAWDDITGKPDFYPSDWSTLANKPSLMVNPMVYPGDIIWNGLEGEPVALHGLGTPMGWVLTWDSNAGPRWAAPQGGGGGGTGAWDDITGKPDTYPSDWSTLASKPETFPPERDAPVTQNWGEGTLDYSLSRSYLRILDAAPSVVVVPKENAPWFETAEFTVEQAGTGTVTFRGEAGVTLNVRSERGASTSGQFGVVHLKRVRPDEWTLYGDLGPYVEPPKEHFVGFASMSDRAEIISIAPPASFQIGDLMIATLSCPGDQLFLVPSGWTARWQGQAAPASGVRMYVLTKAFAGEPALSFTKSGAVTGTVTLAAYRDVEFGQIAFSVGPNDYDAYAFVDITPSGDPAILVSTATASTVNAPAVEPVTSPLTLRGKAFYARTPTIGDMGSFVSDKPATAQDTQIVVGWSNANSDQGFALPITWAAAVLELKTIA
jgi:hypothetical protein